jgi:hypothetical protein
MLPPAHGGDVLLDLPVFLGPIVALTLWLLAARRRDDSRRTARGRTGPKKPL